MTKGRARREFQRYAAFAFFCYIEKADEYERQQSFIRARRTAVTKNIGRPSGTELTFSLDLYLATLSKLSGLESNDSMATTLENNLSRFSQ